MKYEALIEVRLKPGIADPEGKTIESNLPAMGFTDISEVSVGRSFRLIVEAEEEGAAHGRAQELCDKLLANPVLERASVEIRPAPARGGA